MREAKPLKTADDAAKNKLNQFRDMLFTERMTEAQFGYEKRPLAFEVTGAMGDAMQKHVKEMAKKYASKFPEGTAIPSLQQQGDPDHTKSSVLLVKSIRISLDCVGIAVLNVGSVKGR